MSKIPVGVQLYSVRDDCKKDFLATLKAVAKMGYAGVEFAGYHNWSAADLRKTLDELGLKCCGTHTGIDTVSDANLKQTIEFNKTIGNTFLIIPWIPEEKRNTVESSLQTAKEFTALVEKVKPYGMRVGFHTHDCDCKPLPNSKEGAWTVIGDNTPKEFVLQLDTANSMHGGADPVALLKKYPGRGGTVHLKEFSSKPDAKVLLGEGEVKWKEVFAACENGAGTEWYIIEHEIYGMPPLDCIAGCLKNLKAMGK